MKENIIIKGAKVHNLKNINVTIPKNKLVVFTGLSGSGKSSLAFDTIYAEGQRRYIESMSSYVRQFIGQMDKPDVDQITGLSPSIAIDQKTRTNNPRSTVGTVTEIYDYLRLLYAKIGIAKCPKCKVNIEKQTIDEIIDKISLSNDGDVLEIISPLVSSKKGEFQDLFISLRRQGHTKIEVDNNIYYLDEEDVILDKNIKHDISIYVDKFKYSKDKISRIYDSVSLALKLSEGTVKVKNNEKVSIYSTKYNCNICGSSIQEITTRLFSFNSPFGACKSCNGLGYKVRVDLNKVIKNDNISLKEGVLNVSAFNVDVSYPYKVLEELSKMYNFSLDEPFNNLSKKHQEILLYGTDKEVLVDMNTNKLQGKRRIKYEGVINLIQRRYNESQYDKVKERLQKYMSIQKCLDCKGKRLNQIALSVYVNNKNIDELSSMSINDIMVFFNNIELTKEEEIISKEIIKEIKARLSFLLNVGLEYLSLSRYANTLSGGESQRIKLATQIGSGLTGVLYVLDEPSIGLHQRDNDRLISTLKNLRDLGNTVIVVEHDEDTILESDYVVDIGPEAGINGGHLVYSGDVENLKNCKDSITGKYLSQNLKIEVPKNIREEDKGYIEIVKANANNLKNISVKIPLNKLVAITGVSGSGKSSLINHTLLPSLTNYINKELNYQINCKEIKNANLVDKIISIDQSPIGKTPRSNPATYSGVFDHIRNIFANTNQAKERGYKAAAFSFNLEGGRCEHCKGDGIIKIEMQFLSDVYVKCTVCDGKRYTKDILNVKYKNKNIYDVLDMTIEEAKDFFINIPSIYNILSILNEVGLSYMKLGQSSTTLSGGEAQRLKLAYELSKKSSNKTLYILDEPTTGLHFDDVKKLIKSLNKLVDNKSSVIIIEHNLDVIKSCDYIIEIGPDGGYNGGQIINKGKPKDFIENKNSPTAKYLKKIINKNLH